jgi:hypothetical protein
VHSTLASHPFDGSAITLLVCIRHYVPLSGAPWPSSPSPYAFFPFICFIHAETRKKVQTRIRLATKSTAFGNSPTPTPAPSHNSPPSSPASSKYSTHSLSGLPPLSSPYACRIKWFEILGNSLGFNLGPIPNLASSSQPAPVAPPNSLENSAPYPSLVNFPPVQYLCEGFLGVHR